MTAPAIILDEVSKRYRIYSSPKDRLREIFGLNPKRDRVMEVNALQSISIAINKGEFCGVIGRNGAGKSTLLKLIAGQSSPSEGTIKVFGRLSLLQLGLGFDPELTGRENVHNSLRFLFMSPFVAEDVIDRIVQFSELGEFINFPVKAYSTGMYSRLAFATGIVIDPDILIADEVLAVGDINFSQKCLAKMREFKERGKTVILVTHDLGAVRTFCDRAILIEHGRVLRDGESRDVCEDYRNLMLYGVLLPADPVTRNPADLQALEGDREPKQEVGSKVQPYTDTDQQEVGAADNARESTQSEASMAAAEEQAQQPEPSIISNASTAIAFEPELGERWLKPRKETFVSVLDAGHFEAVRIRDRSQASHAARVIGGSPTCFDLKFVMRDEYEFHSVGFTMHDDRGQIMLHINTEFVGFVIARKPHERLLGLSFVFNIPRFRTGQYSFSYSVNVIIDGEPKMAFKHDYDFSLEIYHRASPILDFQCGAVLLDAFNVEQIRTESEERVLIEAVS
jgi:ABC-type polysaccharide/polyol phosphate transport system ATPase subunit